MPRRDSIPVARNSVRANVWAAPLPCWLGGVWLGSGLPGAGLSGGPVDVDQFVLEETLVDDGEPAGRHEPTGRERGKAELVGPTFCRQPPLHHVERATRHAT